MATGREQNEEGCPSAAKVAYESFVVLLFRSIEAADAHTPKDDKGMTVQIS